MFYRNKVNSKRFLCQFESMTLIVTGYTMKDVIKFVKEVLPKGVNKTLADCVIIEGEVIDVKYDFVHRIELEDISF